MLIEAFFAESPVEALGKRVVHRLAGFDKLQPNAGPFRPLEHRPTGTFGTVVEDNLFR